MKRLFWIGLCAILALACTREMPAPVSGPVASGPAAAAVAAPVDQADKGIVPGVAIVYAGESLAARWTQDVRKAPVGLKVRSVTRLFPDAGEYEPRTRKEGLHRWLVVEFDASHTYSEAKECLSAIEGIEYVQPRRLVRRNITLNDNYWSQMWGMNGAYSVNCIPVWENFTMGNPAVHVGVIDGGIQLDHPDLAANVSATGHYNYVRNTGTINQDDHGTHVAGTIAAVNNNNRGVTGIAGGNAAAGKPGVKLISLQVFDGNSSAADFSRAVKEAADRGAIISQNSWGNYFDFDNNGVVSGYELDYARYYHENPDRSFTQAVDYFNKYAGCDNDGNQLPDSPMKGGLVIFAAGNENLPYGSPGNYDGCVSVGAISSNGSRASFSNYGDWVDICAPGVNVPSTIWNNGYASYSGTSMACPHVSGVAALIVSHFGGQGFTADELRARLLSGARTISASSGTKPIGPLVDAYGAFVNGGQGGSVAPDPVEITEVTPVGHNLRVSFRGSGAYAYLALASKQESALKNVDYKNPASGISYATRMATVGEEAGVEQSILLSGLDPSTQYSVAVVAYSYSQLYSALSSIVRIETAQNRKPAIEMPDYPTETGFEFPHYQMVSIPVMFSDPDGDMVQVSFDARNGRATLDPQQGQGQYSFNLMCPLVTPGTYQFVITATDELGVQTKKVIRYTVKENTAPEVVSEPAPVVLEYGQTSFELDVEKLFRDSDGESLGYTASTRNRKVAMTRLEGNILTVESVGPGMCTVHISCVDHEDERAEVDLTVVVKPEGAGEVFLAGDSVVTGGNITLIPGIEEAPLTLRIISSAGVVVYTCTGNYSAAHPLEVNVDSLAPGIYTLEISYNGQTYTQILVKR